MEVTIIYNGQAVTVEVTLEVYEFLDRADHKTENLFHEQRRHWDCLLYTSNFKGLPITILCLCPQRKGHSETGHDPDDQHQGLSLIHI